MRPSSAETSEPACTKRKMLSMKRSTSAPSSRKYSAIVRPDSATRRRAPGGSFIWPNTSAVSASTPDSVISSQRSLPSRVRSPTPADTPLPRGGAPARLGHLEPEVGALARPLADAGEHRVALVLARDAPDQLLD